MLPVFDGLTPYFEEFTIKDRRCWIRDNGLGVLCGYTEISEEERYVLNRNPEEHFVGLAVHGGITWQDIHCGENIQAQENCWIIGFDCNHFSDHPHPEYATKSEIAKIYSDAMDGLSHGSYKDEQYVFRALINLVMLIEEAHEKMLFSRPKKVVW